MFLLFLVVVSDYLALSASIPLFFVPKYAPLIFSLRFWPKVCFVLCVLWFLVVFSDSLALSASIPLFFVPQFPLGADFGPKQISKKKKT